MSRLAPPWVYGIAEAVRLNLHDRHVRESTPAHIAKEFAAIPYRFLGERHPVTDMVGARRRRWAACADAAAAIIASAVAGDEGGHLCIEAPPSLPTYTHVRVVLDDGVILDPYAPWRADVPASCEWLVSFRELLSSQQLVLRPAVMHV